MKVRIIKRKDLEKVVTEVAVAVAPSERVDARTAMTATVNSWIDEFRQKRDEEQRLSRQLIKAESFG